MGSSQPPIRLAILEADTPLPQTRAKYHGYGGVFTNLFTRAVAPAPLSSVLDITLHQIVEDPESYPSLDDVDAVLITGSKHDSFSDPDWILRLVDFTREAIASGKVRVVGVCFGHQIIGRALGVPVGRSKNGWEVSVTPIDLSAEGKEFFSLEKLNLFQMHRDAVYSLPANAISLASTENCPMQGFMIPNRALTVQGHPEFTEPIVKEILESRVGYGVLTEELFKSGMERVGKEHDGVKVAQAFIKFMRGD